MSEETFGEELRRRREELDLSQRALATLARIRMETVGNIERGAPFRQKTRRFLLRALEAAEHGDSPPPDEPTESAAAAREAIASLLDSVADGIPQDLVAADSTSPEAVALRTACRAYRHAARIARGEDL